MNGNLSDLGRDVIVGARWAGLSVSKTADVLKRSCRTISKVYSLLSKMKQH